MPQSHGLGTNFGRGQMNPLLVEAGPGGHPPEEDKQAGNGQNRAGGNEDGVGFGVGRKLRMAQDGKDNGEEQGEKSAQAVGQHREGGPEFSRRMKTHDIKNAERIASTGTGESEGKEKPGPGEGAGAAETDGHAEDPQHEQPADGAEELGKQGGEESAQQPDGVRFSEHPNGFRAQRWVAENSPEEENGKRDLEDEKPVFAHAEVGELHHCVPRVETHIVSKA